MIQTTEINLTPEEAILQAQKLQMCQSIFDFKKAPAKEILMKISSSGQYKKIITLDLSLNDYNYGRLLVNERTNRAYLEFTENINNWKPKKWEPQFKKLQLSRSKRHKTIVLSRYEYSLIETEERRYVLTLERDEIHTVLYEITKAKISYTEQIAIDEQKPINKNYTDYE